MKLLIRVKTKCILPCQFVDRLQSKLNDAAIHAIPHRQVTINLHEPQVFQFFTVLSASNVLIRLRFVFKDKVFLGEEFIHFDLHLVKFAVSEQEFRDFDQVRLGLIVLGFIIFSLFASNLIVVRLNYQFANSNKRRRDISRVFVHIDNDFCLLAKIFSQLLRYLS